MSRPPNRLSRWDSRRGAPSWGDSGHFFFKKKTGAENDIKSWCEKEPFFRLCRSIKVRESLQQPEDWCQGLRIGYCDEIQDTGLRVGAIQVTFLEKNRGRELHQNLVWKRALFQTLPVYESKRLASAARRLMSGPPHRVLRWDSRRGAPSWGDSGHFFKEKTGGENYIKTWCENEPFFRLCRSMKVRDSLEQPEDWCQGLRVWTIQVSFLRKMWGRKLLHDVLMDFTPLFPNKMTRITSTRSPGP
jgi:hypothetical protein